MDESEQRKQAVEWATEWSKTWEAAASGRTTTSVYSENAFPRMMMVARWINGEEGLFDQIDTIDDLERKLAERNEALRNIKNAEVPF